MQIYQQYLYVQLLMINLGIFHHYLFLKAFDST